MKRLATVLLCLLALPVLLLGSLPFTEGGSRWLSQGLSQFTPVQVDFAGGRLFGAFRLHQLELVTDGVSLRLQGVAAELDPACLWESLFCLRQLTIEQLEVAVDDAGGEPEADAGRVSANIPLQLPVRVLAPALQVQGTTVSWPGGSWTQGPMGASVRVESGGIAIRDARIESPRLNLTPDAQPSTATTALPPVWLPFALAVEGLELRRPGWSVGDSDDALEVLSLDGRWQGHRLQIERFAAQRPGWGQLAGEAAVVLDGDYALSAQLTGTHDTALAWPVLQQRDFSLTLEGDLGQLEAALELPGTPALSLQASGKLLHPDLPFSAELESRWGESLALAELLTLPADAPAVSLQSPWRASASGDLERQSLQLDGALSGMGYEELAVNLDADHGDGRLAVTSLSLAEAGADGSSLLASGSLAYQEGLEAALQLASPGLTLPEVSEYLFGRVAGALDLQFAWRDDSWSASLRELDLEGEVNGLPASASGRLALSEGQWLRGGALDFSLNGARGRLREGTRADLLDWNLEVSDLGRWQRGASGQLTIQGELDTGRGAVSVEGSGEGLQFQGWRIEQLSLVGEGALEQEASTGELTLVGVQSESLFMPQVQIVLGGDQQGRSVRLSSSGDIAGEIAAELQPVAGGWRGSLAPADLQTPAGQWQLRAPVALAFSSQQLTVAAHCWNAGSNRLCAEESRIGADSGEVQLALAGDLSLLRPWVTEQVVELGGSLGGEVKVAWSGQDGVKARLRAQLNEAVVSRQLQDGSTARHRWDRFWVRGDLAAGVLALEGAIEHDGQTLMSVDLTLPAARNAELSGALALSALELAPLQAFLPQLTLLDGYLEGRWILSGPLDAPRAEGQLAWREGALGIISSPSTLTEVELVLDLAGSVAEIDGRARVGGGPIDLDGRLQLGSEPELKLRVKGEDNRLEYPPAIELVVSPDLQLAASLSRVSVRGSLRVLEGSLRQEQLPEGSIDVSDDVVQVDYAGNVLSQTRPFDTRVDVRVQIDDRFRVLGENLEVVVGGDLQLQQASGKPPQLFGNLNVVGGELRAYGQRLNIKQGRISFAGLPENPELDLRAEREIPLEQVTAGVSVNGTLEEPIVEVYTEPVMSQAESLSYLVRGRGLDSGAGADGTALALSLGTGLVNRSAVVEGLNRLPGLSNVEFGAEGSEDDTAATVSGYIGERIYLSYGLGLYEPVNVLTARLYLQTRLWLEVVSRLENSVDLYYSFDID